MDISKVLNKIAELEDKTLQRNLLWKPVAGTQQVRIVPYKHDKDNPFQELYFHYNLAKKTMISPITFGQPDPVQEMANRLKATGSKEDYKLGKSLEPKRRTYVPVLVRGLEGEGVKFWGIGNEVYMQLLKTIADPDYGDITDPIKGRDIVVEFEPSKGVGTYPKTTVRIKPNSSPLSDNRQVIQMLDQVPEVTTLWEMPSYSELETHLKNYIENPTEGDSGQTDHQPVAQSGNNAIDDVMSDFDKLFS